MDSFKERWIDSMTERIKMVHPNDPIEQIREFASDLYKKNFKDSDASIYNNYEMTNIDTSISRVINWLDVKKPILTESGSLFKNHDECWNPNAIIINTKLDDRGRVKAEKFKYSNMGRDETDPVKKDYYYYIAGKKDLEQGRIKVIVNSEYGVSGLLTSWFFNMACASATTARGQALISTAFNAFEDFIADGVMFQDMDECISFIYNIVSEKDKRKLNDDVWVKPKNITDTFYRLKDKFISEDICDDDMLISVLRNLDPADISRIYYKSNLYEFVRNSDKATALIRKIVNSNEEFMDPVKPPKEIKHSLDKLRPAILEYVHYNYQFSDRVTRLKSHRRKTVVVIDTDSNFINLGPWVHFVEGLVKGFVRIKSRKRHNGRDVISSRNRFKSKEFLADEQNKFRIINIMTNIIDTMIGNVLMDFLDRCNVARDNPGTTLMKNEFMYPKILITDAKKHYQAVMRLQEGNVVPYDINRNFTVKGMEYLKPSSVGPRAREFIRNLIYYDILSVDRIDTVKILRKLSAFENEVRESVLSGDPTHIKTAKVKTADSYADPMTIGQYKAVWIWNNLYPDKAIELPGICHIIPMKIKKPQDFTGLSITNPELFNKLLYLFEQNKYIAKSGISNLAIPIDEQVPDDLKPYIDISDILSKTLSLLKPVLSAIGLKSINKTKSSMYFSNFIDI